MNRTGVTSVVQDMNRLLRLVAAAAAVAFVVAACGSDDSPDTAGAPATTAAATTSASAGGEATSSAPAAGAATITIKDFKYGEPLTVAPGTTITVTNEDTAGHDVVSDDAGKFKTPVLAKGEKATFTAPMEPGTYKYSCSLHLASMSGIGTLIVSG